MKVNKRLELYINNIKVKYDIQSNRENAYLYNRGYIMGLNDGKAINNKDAFTLIELNCGLRNSLRKEET